MLPVGELASLAAAVCWAVGLTMFRRDVRAVGSRAVNLFKGVLAGALFVAVLAAGPGATVPLRAQVLLALSGVLGLALGDTLLFGALGMLGPHRTALLGSLGPVMTATGAWIFLGEALPAVRLAGIALAVAGIATVIYARRGAVDEARATLVGVALGVAGAACHAGGVLLAKVGLREADELPATALRLVAATAVLALVGLGRRDLDADLRKLLRRDRLARLVPAAFIGTFLGLWFMQIGIKRTDTAVANTLHSTTPLFTLPIAVFVLRERMGAGTWIGSIIAVGGVAILLLT